MDEAACELLTRVRAPWVVVPNSSSHKLDWSSPELTRKAVIWLSLKLKKSVLKLQDEDYINNNLEQLLDYKGSAHKINLDVFNFLKVNISHFITFFFSAPSPDGPEESHQEISWE